MAGDPCGWSLTVDGEAADAQTLDDLAKLLRHLRRRNARAHGHNPLTYRELAKTTGWALGVISDYFNGKILPPIDRFDVLIQLLGATPAEQGVLAAFRDRVEEHQRRPSRDDRQQPAQNREASRSVPARAAAPDPPVRGLAPYPPQAAGRNGRAVNGPPPNGSTVYDAPPDVAPHPARPAVAPAGPARTLPGVPAAARRVPDVPAAAGPRHQAVVPAGALRTIRTGPGVRAVPAPGQAGPPSVSRLRSGVRSMDRVPRQVPTPAWQFTGRTAELAELTALSGRVGTTAAICVIDGAAGVGKTALALHWAHRAAGDFPDGQLYADLRGFDPTAAPVAPGEVLHGFLEALAVPPQAIPASLDGRAALYRSRLAGRRILVVLDNAADADQVRPLLPAGQGNMAVITSRGYLFSLVTANGAHPVALDLMSRDEARDLLRRRLGGRRTGPEPEAVDEIIARCGRLPLALAIVAARASARPQFPLSGYAAELRDSGHLLDAFSNGDEATDVRCVFSWSYRQLPPTAARLFRLIGLHPGAEISAEAAASLAGLAVPAVRGPLEELTRAHLIAESAPGRYVVHDLLRSYAAEQSRDTDRPAERDEALHRMFGHYLHAALAASRLVHPRRRNHAAGPVPAAGAVRTSLDGPEQALAWLTAEHPTLLAALPAAYAAGLDAHALHLAWALSAFQTRQGRWSEMLGTQRIGLEAACRLGDRMAQAQAHRDMGFAAIELGQVEEADSRLRQALEIAEELGDGGGQAQTHLGFSRALERRGRFREALRHCRAAHELYRGADDPVGQANALNSLGWCHTMLGEHQDARYACERALVLVRRLGDRWIEAAAWDSLGQVHHNLADHGAAAACYDKALELCRALRDRPNEAQTLIHLGDSRRASGDLDAARDAWRAALAIQTELDYSGTEEIEARIAEMDTQQSRSGTRPAPWSDSA